MLVFMRFTWFDFLISYICLPLCVRVFTICRRWMCRAQLASLVSVVRHDYANHHHHLGSSASSSLSHHRHRQPIAFLKLIVYFPRFVFAACSSLSFHFYRFNVRCDWLFDCTCASACVCVFVAHWCRLLFPLLFNVMSIIFRHEFFTISLLTGKKCSYT